MRTRSLLSAAPPLLMLALGGCATPQTRSEPPPPPATAPESTRAPALQGAAPTPLPPATVQRALAHLEEGLASSEGPLRAEAHHALGLSRMPSAGQRLVGALKDKDGQIRFFAARGLAELGDPQSGPAIVEAWQGERGWAVKKELALAAGSARAHALVPDLREQLQAPQAELRLAAAWALSDLGDATGSRALAELGHPPRPGAQPAGAERWSRRVLRGEREGDRRLAVRVLSKLATADDQAVLEALLQDSDGLVRTFAAAGLLRLSAGAAPMPPRAPK
jgi:HEAT repeat protein